MWKMAAQSWHERDLLLRRILFRREKKALAAFKAALNNETTRQTKIGTRTKIKATIQVQESVEQ